MKTTGMVRRVDSLGRIVIPKEIRKVLKIKENEKIIKENIDKFIEIYKLNLINLLSNKKEKIEKLVKDNINISEYEKYLRDYNKIIEENINNNYSENIDNLINNIIVLYEDSFCNLRIKEYLQNILREEIKDKIMDTINGRDIILLNTFQETYLKYLELNKNTIGIKN